MTTAQQICTLSAQIAKVPGMTAQAGVFLNMVLSELCQNHDFDVAKKTHQGVFDSGLITVTSNGNQIFGGPYDLPADYLRGIRGDSFWTLLGVPYPLTPIDLQEFDMTVQQAGLQSYPYWMATDMSHSPPQAYFYVPPSGNYPFTVRYFSQMPDIVTPETSTDAPWFPNANYLITRVAGELMRIADDERYISFLGDGPEGAQGILDRYLKMKDDKSNRAQMVALDGRLFGKRVTNLPNTKTVGW